MGRYRLILFVFLAAVSADRAEAAPRDARVLAARIDERIAAGWKEREVTPAPPSDDGEFLRRVYLDLAGRIPSIREVRDFLDQRAPDKRDRLVRHLLDSEGHAYHWSNVWRGVMVPPGDNASPFRLQGSGLDGWLRQRIRDRAGFDQIAREILAAKAGEVGPAAFYQANENKAENLAAATSRAFLGVKLECAQCHDHPFAKWTREQFWQYAAFFAGAPPGRADAAAALAQIRQQQQPPRATPGQITIPGTDKTVEAQLLDGARPVLKPGVDPRLTLAEWMTAPENPFFARAAVNRLWEYFFGTGLVEPVDDMAGNDSEASHPELLDELAKEFAAHQFDLRYLIEAITLSRAYQLTSKVSHTSQNEPRLFARMVARGLSPEQLFDSLTEAVGHDGFAPEPGGRVAGGGFGSPRAEFLVRFPPQEKRTAMQTSILQALFLMNGKLMTDATTREGNRNLAVIMDARSGTARQIEELYMITLSRRPTDVERTRLVEYVDKGGPSGDTKKALADVFWALLNSSEFFLNH